MTSFEAIVDSHIQRWSTWNHLSRQACMESESETPSPTVPPSITFSTARGSGAEEIIGQVAGKLGYQVLDREILQAICQSTPIQKRIMEALDKGDRTVVPSLPEQIFTKHFIDDTSYLNTLTRVVRFIALLGPAVFIGRGTAFILRESEAVNLRIVADPIDRVERLLKENINPEIPSVERILEEDDQVKRRFIRTYFKREIDDATAYHLVINTSRIDRSAIVDLILNLYQASMKVSCSVGG
ncbi:MAG: cytidylate kinase-like family protein [Planctomycetes bacterium]|nr:cytidylate kinase-like family protein [Planctomycetota bacterium]